MAGKIYLGWPNRLADASVSISGGSWLAALPLSNLLVRTPTVIARSTSLSTAHTQFDISLPTTRVLKSFALVNHNLSVSATWRITLGSTLGASDVYDSGALPAWSLNFDNDLLEWESSSWWEGSLDDDYVGHPFSAIHLAATSPAAKYCRIVITDASNPAGYVQLGRVFLGGGISLTLGMMYGMSDAWESNSVVETAVGGSEYFDSRRSARVARFELEGIDQSTEFRQIYEMHRRLGTTGELLYIPDDADVAQTQLTGFVGRMRQLNAIEYPFYSFRKAGYELKELL